jgi:hypothetical protein
MIPIQMIPMRTVFRRVNSPKFYLRLPAVICGEGLSLSDLPIPRYDDFFAASAMTCDVGFILRRIARSTSPGAFW